MGEAALILQPYISIQEYLEGELRSEIRHDYLDGEVFAMAGASAVHEQVAMNLATDLHVFLEGKKCRVSKSDLKLKVQVNRKDAFYYPDIMVACRPTDNHLYYREHPSLLVEVLSEDDGRDLIHKFLVYQRIASLEEYIVLSQNPAAPKAYVHRRVNNWEQEVVELGGTLEIASLDFRVPIERIYRGIVTQQQ